MQNLSASGEVRTLRGLDESVRLTRPFQAAPPASDAEGDAA
jgi:hypothetical protein